MLELQPKENTTAWQSEYRSCLSNQKNLPFFVDKLRNWIEGGIQSAFLRVPTRAVDHIHPIDPTGKTATANATWIGRILAPKAAFLKPIFFVFPIALAAEVEDTPPICRVADSWVHHSDKRLLQSFHGQVLLVLEREQVWLNNLKKQDKQTLQL